MTALLPLLAETRTFLLRHANLNKRPLANRPVGRFHFEGVSWSFSWQSGYGPISAHDHLTCKVDGERLGKALHHVLLETGHLSVGLETVSFMFCESSQANTLTLKPYHSNAHLNARDMAVSLQLAITRLEQATRLLGMVSIDAGAAWHTYLVDGHRVQAPDSKTAVVLGLLSQDVTRLERLLTQGPHAPGQSRLRVSLAITDDGEELFL